MPNRIWTLLRLNPQHQSRYVDHLNSNIPEIQTYYPVYAKKTRPHGHRTPINITLPVYPGYVFTRFDPDLGLHHQITHTPIRVFFVKFGKTIATVPEPVINELKRLESLSLLVRSTQRENPYTPGRHVWVHTPVADIDAIVIHLMGQTRVMVSTALGNAVVKLSVLSLKIETKVSGPSTTTQEYP